MLYFSIVNNDSICSTIQYSPLLSPTHSLHIPALAFELKSKVKQNNIKKSKSTAWKPVSYFLSTQILQNNT